MDALDEYLTKEIQKYDTQKALDLTDTKSYSVYYQGYVDALRHVRALHRAIGDDHGQQ